MSTSRKYKFKCMNDGCDKVYQTEKVRNIHMRNCTKGDIRTEREDSFIEDVRERIAEEHGTFESITRDIMKQGMLDLVDRLVMKKIDSMRDTMTKPLDIDKRDVYMLIDKLHTNGEYHYFKVFIRNYDKNLDSHAEFNFTIRAHENELESMDNLAYLKMRVRDILSTHIQSSSALIEKQ